MNNISFNLTLGQIITIILCLLAFIILIQLIFLLKKAFPMMNKLNKILDDTAVVTEMTADGAKATKERRQIGRASCRKECRSRWSPYH